MARKTLNASRLQELVSRRLHKLQEVIDDGVKFVVPRPQLLQPADRSGCNWTMKHFGNSAGFEASIAQVLADVQAEYNLAVDAEEEEGEVRPDPFGQTAKAADANPFGEAVGPAGKTNPFGAAAGPAKTSNPFGEVKGAGAADPFGAGEPAEPAPKPPADPFGDA
jgi:hypothetical protein